MKIIKTYILLILFCLICAGCDKPAPTELTQDEEEIEVEVLAKDTGDEFYSADSSGVIGDLTGFTNVISLSGIKITRGLATINSDIAQAIFYDKNNPVRRSDGRLLGFATRVLGKAQFNNVEARLIPYRVRFTDGVNRGDSLLGLRHFLNSGFPGQDFNYRFNSSVAFAFNFLQFFGGNSISFNIPTPSEINGSVRLEGKRENGTLRGVIEWNGEHHPRFEVVLGVSVKGSETVYPLYRIRTQDDGKLIIPGNLLSQIPRDRFDKYVFSLYRKTEFYHREKGNELYILSQSIHSTIIDIP
jgi:hypothetical protein